jgi:Flp pilus assembly protein TadD
MARWILILLAAGALQAQSPSPEQPPAQGQDELKTQRPAPARNDAIEAPPEEDKSLAVTAYSFNPLQSEKDVRVGNYYFKAGNYHAAEGRYRDATRWNEDNSDAWLRLAVAAVKSKDSETAKEAYSKYLKLQPDAKDAADVRKKLAKLK